MSDPRKTCPDCGASAMLTAPRCSSCGHWFAQDPDLVRGVADPTRRRTARMSTTFGCLGFLAAFVALPWVPSCSSRPDTSRLPVALVRRVHTRAGKSRNEIVPGASSFFPSTAGVRLSSGWEFTINDAGTGRITGSVKTGAIRPVYDVRLLFDILDRRGVPIESTFASVNRLGADEIWHFEAVVLQTDRAVAARAVDLAYDSSGRRGTQ
jgi:hypothetical protein